MADFGFAEMQAIQRELQEKYKERWSPIEPGTGREKLLWMMIEAGEIADVLKKNGDEAVLKQADVRRHFIEEICDTLMYLNDVMLCYGITTDELRKVYRDKHQRNMGRW